MTSEAVTPSRALDWLRQGTDHLKTHIAKVAPHQLHSPTGLPGWTLAHLLTHLARNADALGNLTEWAATGVESPMYPGGAAQRAADIDDGIRRDPDTILRDALDSADQIVHRLEHLPAPARATMIRTARDRTIPASQIPWLRIREVWIHAIDLGNGATFTDLSADLADTLLLDVISHLTDRRRAPTLELQVEPAGTRLSLRPGTPSAARVTGDAPALLGWLTGRTDGDDLTTSSPRLPGLPAWL